MSSSKAIKLLTGNLSSALGWVCLYLNTPILAGLMFILSLAILLGYFYEE